MIRKLWIIAIAILLTTSLNAKKVAMLVGVNSVKGEFPLFVDRDLQTMESLLRGYDFKDIEVIKGDDATLTNLRAKFKKLAKELKSSDIFLFYYTGHGARMKSLIPYRGPDNFFVLHQADFDFRNNTIYGGVLTDKEFSNHLYKIRAKKISIVDACHSGTIYKSFSNHSHIKSILSKGEEGIFERGDRVARFSPKNLNNFINISAATDEQQAENSPKGSIFTLALVDTIRQNPSITFKELEKRVRWKTKQTARSLAQTFPQTSIYAKLTGDFTPVLKTIPKKFERLLVKDVFSKNGRFTLDSIFETPPKTQKTKLTISSDKKSYHLNEPIIIRIKSSLERGYLYLFEKKSDNYLFLGEKKLSQCSKSGSTSYCQFRDIYASTPYEKSTIHAIITKNQLNIDRASLSKDLEIIGDSFDEESLAREIEKKRIGWAKLRLETIR
jgi:hypothetical protein